MVTYYQISDTGARPVNEDSVCAVNQAEQQLFVLADGLGGHGRGDEASQLVTGIFEREFAADKKKTETFLEETFQLAQDELMRVQAEKRAQSSMKTTAVALWLRDGKATWGHIGDSRLYGFRRNKVCVRTLDHSVPQMLVLAGEIKEKQIRKHPDRSRLLRVMGVPWEEPRFEIADTVKMKEYQAFLLCSDGFWELIDEKTMGKLLKKSSTPEEWVTAMVEEVKRNGTGEKMDNFSAIAVFCQ